MNGPQHYAEAEHDLARADAASIDDGWSAVLVARAQVHATLALAAAVVDKDGVAFNAEAWTRVTPGPRDGVL